MILSGGGFMDLVWMIILPSAAIKKAQYFGLVLDSFFTLAIQIDEKNTSARGRYLEVFVLK
jgi:hypothetical protein